MSIDCFVITDTFTRLHLILHAPNIVQIWSITTKLKKINKENTLNQRPKWIPEFWWTFNVYWFLWQMFSTSNLEIFFWIVSTTSLWIRHQFRYSTKTTHFFTKINWHLLLINFVVACSYLLSSGYFDFELWTKKLRNSLINIAQHFNANEPCTDDEKLTICSNWFVWFQSACFRSNFSYACVSPFTVLFFSLIVRNYQK